MDGTELAFLIGFVLAFVGMVVFSAGLILRMAGIRQIGAIAIVAGTAAFAGAIIYNVVSDTSVVEQVEEATTQQPAEVQQPVTVMQPPPHSGNGSGSVVVGGSDIPSSSAEAAHMFGGNAESWEPLGGTGWIYRGSTVDFTVPAGFRIDTPFASCDGSGSVGIYGPANVRTNQATVWWIDREVNCGR